jgi:hypothetical protein
MPAAVRSSARRREADARIKALAGNPRDSVMNEWRRRGKLAR